MKMKKKKKKKKKKVERRSDFNDGVSIVMDQQRREFDKYVCGSFVAPGFRSTNRYWSGSCLRLISVLCSTSRR